MTHPLLSSDPLADYREDACDEYLASVIQNPSEGRECIVDSKICTTITQHHVYNAIRSVVASGGLPSLAELSEYMKSNKFSLDVLLPYTNLPAQKSPRILLPRINQIITATKIREALKGIDLDLDHVSVDAASKKLTAAFSAAASSGTRSSSMRELAASALEMITLNASGVSFGWPTLDQALRLYPGDVMVVGADSGIGKSTALLSWLLHQCARQIPVTMISAEDDERVLGSRVVSSISDVPLYKWSLSRWSKEDFEKLERTDFSLPFNSYYLPKGDIDDVIRCMSSAAFAGAKVVAVDYFQALTIEGRFGGDVERFNEILNRLVVAAKRSGVVLLLASQIRKRMASAKDSPEPIEPRPEDLLGTGQLYRRAQAVVMLWGDRSENVSARLAKAKNARAGAMLTLRRDPASGRLTEVTPSSGYDDARGII